MWNHFLQMALCTLLGSLDCFGFNSKMHFLLVDILECLVCSIPSHEQQRHQIFFFFLWGHWGGKMYFWGPRGAKVQKFAKNGHFLPFFFFMGEVGRRSPDWWGNAPMPPWCSHWPWRDKTVTKKGMSSAPGQINLEALQT